MGWIVDLGRTGASEEVGMTEFKFICPHCEQHVQAPRDMCGETVPCPSCGGKLVVPSAPDARNHVDGQSADERLSETPRDVVYAGFWRRGLAFVLDEMILDPGYLALTFLLGNAVAVIVRGADFWGVVLPVIGLGACMLTWFYFTLMESSRHQATLGKQFFGIVVTDLEGKGISFWRASARLLAPSLLSIPFWAGLHSQLRAGRWCWPLLGVLLLLPFVGLMTMLFTRRKQAFHDWLTGCVVLRRIPDTGRLHNLAAWRVALAIAGITALSSAATLTRSSYMRGAATGERAFLIWAGSVFWGSLVFVLVFIVKALRNRGRPRVGHEPPGTRCNSGRRAGWFWLGMNWSKGLFRICVVASVAILVVDFVVLWRAWGPWLEGARRAQAQSHDNAHESWGRSRRGYVHGLYRKPIIVEPEKKEIVTARRKFLFFRYEAMERGVPMGLLYDLYNSVATDRGQPAIHDPNSVPALVTAEWQAGRRESYAEAKKYLRAGRKAFAVAEKRAAESSGIYPAMLKGKRRFPDFAFVRPPLRFFVSANAKLFLLLLASLCGPWVLYLVVRPVGVWVYRGLRS